MPSLFEAKKQIRLYILLLFYNYNVSSFDAKLDVVVLVFFDDGIVLGFQYPNPPTYKSYVGKKLNF